MSYIKTIFEYHLSFVGIFIIFELLFCTSFNESLEEFLFYFSVFLMLLNVLNI